MERKTLDAPTHAVWSALAETGEALDVDALIERTGLGQAQITAVATLGADDGTIELEELRRDELVPTAEAAELLDAGLPEHRAARRLAEAGGEMAIQELTAWTQESGVAPPDIFRWGPARGWIERVKGEGGLKLVLTDAGRAALGSATDDERALRLALERTGAGERLYLDELAAAGIDAAEVEKMLAKRGELAKLKSRTQRTLKLTDAGRAALAVADVKQEKTALTPEDIQSGAWRNITLRPYDVTLEAARVYPAKIHPLRKIQEEIRRTFLEMGFEEIVSPMVESAFWNFDALYQPQDHPARDMQDTFYMADPARVDLPPAERVEPVRRTHEDGWETGSEGWGYRWSAETARRVVLRTHTTAATIRALAADPNPPRKVFCVGWTYRNETISFKHLPVFHQVDGVVIDEEANLSTLLGTLQEFYYKMGFGQVKFKPAFYPYTEPSCDVVVYMESRGKWLEMGGSGIFRPEVTQPLGCKHPVLAWGLGVERLAMLRYGFDDIRDLYRSNLDAMEDVGLSR